LSLISLCRIGLLAQGNSIDIAGVHTETCDAPSELMHDHEHPVAL
jgi:hypothetical protein